MAKKKYVKVIFPSDGEPDEGKKEYLFCSYEPLMFPGTYVVCDTRYGFTVGKISCNNVPESEVQKFNANLKGMREIVTSISVQDFFDRKAKRAQAAELKIKMDERMKTLQEKAVYELMAKADPEIARLLQEYNTLEEV